MKKTLTIIFTVLLIAIQAKAIKYTAISSGNFTSTSTWQGGVVPPSNVSQGDTIQIIKNVSINLDIDLTINHNTKLILDSNAHIAATNKHFIENIHGRFIGKNCSISVDSILHRGTFEYYEGDVTVNKISLRSHINGKVNLTVKDVLKLGPGGGSFDKCTLNLGTSQPIHIIHAGGHVDTSKSILDFDKPFDITYTDQTYDISDAPELGKKGVRNINIDIGPWLTDVMFISKNDLVIKHKLTLLSGVLSFSGKHLILGPDASIDHVRRLGYLSLQDTSRVIIYSNLNNIGNFPITRGGIYSLEMKSTTNPKATIYFRDIHVPIQNITLSKGRIALDSAVILPPNFSSPIIISGGSENSYIITGNESSLERLTPLNNALTYPIGTADFYAPIIIKNFKGLSIWMQASVRKGVYKDVVKNAGYNYANSKPVVDLTWGLSPQTQLNPNEADIEVVWDTSAQVNNFDKADAQLVMSEYQKWVVANKAPAKNAAPGFYKTAVDKVRLVGRYFTVVNSNVLSVEELAQTSTATTLYPNPATNTLYLNHIGSKPISGHIYNTSGCKMKDIVIFEGNNTINIEELPLGIYFIKLIGDGDLVTYKFIKQ